MDLHSLSCPHTGLTKKNGLLCFCAEDFEECTELNRGNGAAADSIGDSKWSCVTERDNTSTSQLGTSTNGAESIIGTLRHSCYNNLVGIEGKITLKS